MEQIGQEQLTSGKKCFDPFEPSSDESPDNFLFFRNGRWSYIPRSTDSAAKSQRRLRSPRWKHYLFCRLVGRRKAESQILRERHPTDQTRWIESFQDRFSHQ